MEILYILLGAILTVLFIYIKFVRKGRRVATSTDPKTGEKIFTQPKEVVIQIDKPKRLVAKNENYYNKIIAEDMGIKANVTLPNGLKADMISDTHAYEIDFGGMKTYEGIGQSLVYAHFTNKLPGLIILIRDDKEEKLFKKIEPAIPGLGIDLTVYRVKDRVTGEFVTYEELNDGQME